MLWGSSELWKTIIPVKRIGDNATTAVRRVMHVFCRDDVTEPPSVLPRTDHRKCVARLWSPPMSRSEVRGPATVRVDLFTSHRVGLVHVWNGGRRYWRQSDDRRRVFGLILMTADSLIWLSAFKHRIYNVLSTANIINWINWITTLMWSEGLQHLVKLVVISSYSFWFV